MVVSAMAYDHRLFDEATEPRFHAIPDFDLCPLHAGADGTGSRPHQPKPMCG